MILTWMAADEKFCWTEKKLQVPWNAILWYNKYGAKINIEQKDFTDSWGVIAQSREENFQDWSMILPENI